MTMMPVGALLLLLTALAAAIMVECFVGVTVVSRSTRPRREDSRLFLEDWVADMIDQELFRQKHRREYEVEWMEKNRQFIFHSFDRDEEAAEPEGRLREYQRDRVMAVNDPKRYCADRCITTGNCDALEDFYRFSAKQVIEFCEECVLDESEPACQLPETHPEGTTDVKKADHGRLEP